MDPHGAEGADGEVDGPERDERERHHEPVHQVPPAVIIIIMLLLL